MKIALFLFFFFSLKATTLALASNTTSLQFDLPDSRFTTKLSFGPDFLPVGPTLANIMHFMSLISRYDFRSSIASNTYATITYPQVTISSTPVVEARFLLWGMYLAARDMMDYARFNSVLVDLRWEGFHVGQLSIKLRSTSLQVDSGGGNGGVIVDPARVVPGSDGGFNVTGIGDGIDDDGLTSTTTTTKTTERLVDAPSLNSNFSVSDAVSP